MIFDKHGFTQAADYVWSCFGSNESTFVDTHDFIRLDWAQGSTVQAFPIVNTNFALFFAHWVMVESIDRGFSATSRTYSWTFQKLVGFV